MVAIAGAIGAGSLFLFQSMKINVADQQIAKQEEVTTRGSTDQPNLSKNEASKQENPATQDENLQIKIGSTSC